MNLKKVLKNAAKIRAAENAQLHSLMNVLEGIRFYANKDKLNPEYIPAPGWILVDIHEWLEKYSKSNATRSLIISGQRIARKHNEWLKKQEEKRHDHKH